MPSTAVITDTDACLPLALAKKYNITQVPVTVQFGDEHLRAVYDIDDAETFARIDRDGKMPTTSAPTAEQFAEAYQAAFEAGNDDVICFTVSGEISTTYNSALAAAAQFPGRNITVVDTRNLAIAQGFVALTAAEALAHGMPKGNAIAMAKDTINRTRLFATLPTLRYMAMSGRVGYLAAEVAGFMDLKPILTIRNGKLELLERVRTQSRALGRVVELAVETAVGIQLDFMAIAHVNALETARELEAQLRSYLPCPDEILYTELTPGLSVHTGAGLVGVLIIAGAK